MHYKENCMYTGYFSRDILSVVFFFFLFNMKSNAHERSKIE